MNKNKWIFLSVLLLLTTSSLAFVPPSYFIIRMLARKHAPLDHGIVLRHKVSLYKSGEFYKSFLERFTLTSNGVATTQLTDDGSVEFSSHKRRISSSREEVFTRPILYDLLVVKDATEIFDHFRALELPVNTEADLYSIKEGSLPFKLESEIGYVRFENKVAIVLGFNEKNPTEIRFPQLWVEKDSYLPLRAFVKPGLEFRFSGYTIFRNFLYPKSIQIFKDDVLWVRLDVQEARLEEGSMSIEKLPQKEETDSTIRDFIEKYYKWVR